MTFCIIGRSSKPCEQCFETAGAKSTSTRSSSESKWKRQQENLSVGDCVVIIDPSLMTATGRWPLGRVTKVHLGQDDMVRVAYVRTACRMYTRPIVKLVSIHVKEYVPPADDGPASTA
ncbi:hypothetical protein TKK_0016242 [Trichogramma kaykai]|uniref:DUF5641 domain-containing protein n=1 Tax=Trichogramma kaykai TaxID=54128 RepID=A0ABD2W7U6_9HYME